MPNPEPGILKFIEDHPYEYTKSQISKNAPGAERSNRRFLDSLLKEGVVVSAKVRRSESNRVTRRDLLALKGIDPPATGQQRLAPIGNDQPTIVGQGGAGNSPEAAVSALSEPPAEGNLGDPSVLET